MLILAAAGYADNYLRTDNDNDATPDRINDDHHIATDQDALN